VSRLGVRHREHLLEPTAQGVEPRARGAAGRLQLPACRAGRRLSSGNALIPVAAPGDGRLAAMAYRLAVRDARRYG
jgi:hypothetical protein